MWPRLVCWMVLVPAVFAGAASTAVLAQEPPLPGAEPDPAIVAARQRAIRVLVGCVLVKRDPTAADTLVKLGPEAVPVLLAEWHAEPRADRRLQMMDLLGRMDGLALIDTFPRLLDEWRNVATGGDKERQRGLEQAMSQMNGGLAGPLLDLLDAPDVDGAHAMAHRVLQTMPQPPGTRRMHDYAQFLTMSEREMEIAAGCRLAARMPDAGFLMGLVEQGPGHRAATIALAAFDECPPIELGRVASRLFAAAAAHAGNAAFVDRISTALARAEWSSDDRWCRDLPAEQVAVQVAALRRHNHNHAEAILRRLDGVAARAVANLLLDARVDRATRARAAHVLSTMQSDWPLEAERLAAALATADEDLAGLILSALADRNPAQMAPLADRIAGWLKAHPESAHAAAAARLLATEGPDAARWYPAITAVLRVSAGTAAETDLLAVYRAIGQPCRQAVELLAPVLDDAFAGPDRKLAVLSTLMAIADPDDDRLPAMFRWADRAGLMQVVLETAVEERRIGMRRFLVPLLGRNDRIGELATEKLAGLGPQLVPDLLARRTDDALTAGRAMQVIAQIGPGEEHLPALREWWEARTDLRFQIAQALAATGRPAVPILIELLRKARDLEPAGWIMSAVARIGSAAIPPVAVWLAADDEAERQSGIWILDRVTTADEADVQAAAESLRRALQSSHAETHHVAARLLWVIGAPEARTWLDAQFQQDGLDGHWQDAANWLLGDGQGATAACRALLAWVASGPDITDLRYAEAKAWVERHVDHGVWPALMELAAEGFEPRTILRLVRDRLITLDAPRDFRWVPICRAWVSAAGSPRELKRDAALLLARRFGDAAGTDWLAAHLAAGEPDLQRRFEAAESLLLAGDPRGQRYLAADEMLDRFGDAAIRLLAATGDAAMQKRLADSGATCRDAMRRLGPHAVGALDHLLDQWDALDRATRWDSHGRLMADLLAEVLVGDPLRE